jgi:hypothetical protein
MHFNKYYLSWTARFFAKKKLRVWKYKHLDAASNKYIKSVGAVPLRSIAVDELQCF